jgi:hypothetical protein
MRLPSPTLVALVALACAIWVYAFGIAYDAATRPPAHPRTVNPCIVEYEVDGHTVCVRDEDPQ